jgi:hypothetical protein
MRQIGRDRFAAAPNVADVLFACSLFCNWFWGVLLGRKHVHSLPLATKVALGMVPSQRAGVSGFACAHAAPSKTNCNTAPNWERPLRGRAQSYKCLICLMFVFNGLWGAPWARANPLTPARYEGYPRYGTIVANGS